MQSSPRSFSLCVKLPVAAAIRRGNVSQPQRLETGSIAKRCIAMNPFVARIASPRESKKDIAYKFWQAPLSCSGPCIFFGLFFCCLACLCPLNLLAQAVEDAAADARATASEASSADVASIRSAPEPSETPSVTAPISKTQPLLQLIWQGGPLMVPILICSVVIGVFAMERWISLRTNRVAPAPFVERFLIQLREGQLTKERALALCRANQSEIAEVFAAAVRKWGKPTVEVEQAYLDAGERAANRLRRNLGVFDGVYSLAPLLGLLGTVTGMISAFAGLTGGAAGDRMQLLAKGIGHALVTTAGGLAVAIPALVLHMYFVSRSDYLVMKIDALADELVSLVSAERSNSINSPRERRAKLETAKEDKKAA